MVECPGTLSGLPALGFWDTALGICPSVPAVINIYYNYSYFYRKSDIVAIQTLGQCPGIPTWDTGLEYRPGTLSWDTDLGHCPGIPTWGTVLGHCPGTPTWDTVPKARTVS
ncbi:hypothetical protein BKA70DRAFT_1231499 [Coprinopsis sp. MPI-PUGE-AT-0042]|nr:hypothetical protein BKA70DRAFT_1231499 [Coprinopsis sp. MPI-PUGE-AT-0042]